MFFIQNYFWKLTIKVARGDKAKHITTLYPQTKNVYFCDELLDADTRLKQYITVIIEKTNIQIIHRQKKRAKR
jgi:hypothetical protein